MYCIENTTEIVVLVYQINISYFNISYFKLTYHISTVQKRAILCYGHYGCHGPYKDILWPLELFLTCTTINKCSIFVWYPRHWKHFIVTISKSIKMLISWRNTAQNSNHKNLNLINRHSLCFKSLKFDFSTMATGKCCHISETHNWKFEYFFCKWKGKTFAEIA